MKFRINAAILGSTGYTGIELIRLLSFHKKVEIKYLISKSNYGKKISDFYPGLNFKNYPKLKNVKLFMQNLPNVRFVRMTGSGSSIVGYFLLKNEAINAVKLFKKKYKNHWCITSKTI